MGDRDLKFQLFVSNMGADRSGYFLLIGGVTMRQFLARMYEVPRTGGRRLPLDLIEDMASCWYAKGGCSNIW
jgi:hypothetical protein